MHPVWSPVSWEVAARYAERKTVSTQEYSFGSCAALLLDICPNEQELDAKRLALLCSSLYVDGTIGKNIAKIQIAVKDPNNHSWLIACGHLLHDLPNIYILHHQFFSSEASWKQ